MKIGSEPYENRMSLEGLRAEVRLLWDRKIAFEEALRTLPETINGDALWHLASGAMNIHKPDLWSIAKRVQHSPSGGWIPPKTELECAAGLWIVLREALLARARPATGGREG